MATRTVSNAGGNFNQTTAWVEGVVPVSGDAVVATATSGNLTVTATAPASGQLASMILTGYLGLLTINNGITLSVGGTVTLAGTSAGTGTLLVNASATLTASGATWVPNLTIAGSSATYVFDAWVVTGLLTFSTSSTCNSGSISVTGGITVNAGAISGTTTLTMTGGTWSGNNQLSLSLTFAGACTVSGTVKFADKTLTFSSGSVATGGSTLTLADDSTVNTSPVSWNNVTLFHPGGGSTLTLNSLLTIGGTFNLEDRDGIIFGGTAGWTCATLAAPTASSSPDTYTFSHLNTYTITGSMYIQDGGPSNGHYYAFTSDHATLKATITLAITATQKNGYLNGTRIDSSAGQAIYCGGGTITTCFNWATQITAGNVLYVAGGETVAIAGVTKDNTGAVLGSCDCYLFRDNGNNTPTYLQHQQSNAVTGAYSFSVFPGSTYFVVAFNSGASSMDATNRTLVAV